MIKKFTTERDVKLILDLHGHSRKYIIYIKLIKLYKI